MELHSTNGSWNIWGKIRCHCCTERSKPLPDNRFCLPYNGRVDTKELKKIEH